MVGVPPMQQGFDQAKLYTWMKGLEIKVNSLVREVEVIKNDTIRKIDALKKDMSVSTDDLLELKREQLGFEQKMDLVVKELKQTAGREEVEVIKKYLDFWSPLHFVTQQDVARLVEERLSDHHHNRTKHTKEISPFQ